MALETNIIEFPFTQGQNEGTERAVLQPPQLSYSQNTRYRKGQRLGKRHGYTSVSSLDMDGAALGSGSGRLTCLGPSFCVVDDRFYPRDSVANVWRLPAESFDGGAIAGTRLSGRFPQFLPVPVFEPLNVQSDLTLGAITGTDLPLIGGLTVAQGYIWTCAAYYLDADTTWVVRVVATDPATGLPVFDKTLDPNDVVPATEQQHPVLLSTGAGSVVLIYDHYTAGSKDGVRVRVLTTITGGFSAEVSFACVDSAAAACKSNSTDIMFVYSTGTDDVTVARMNPATMVASTSTTTPNPTGAPTLLSVFENAAGQTWVGLTVSAGGSPGLYSYAYNSSLVLQGVGVNWGAAMTDAVGPILFSERTASTVAAIAGSNNSPPRLNVCDVDSSGVKGTPMRQFSAECLSLPFTIGGQVFVWARHLADAQLGVATLLRVPLASEYTNNGLTPYVRAFPVEATLDDYDIDAPIAAGVSGPPLVTPLASGLGYAALLLATTSTLVAGSTVLLRRFVVVPVRHRSEAPRYAVSCVLPVAGKQFVACSQPMWIDASGCYEAGFIQAPVSTAATGISAGGSLTASSAYSHTAIFESVDTNGLIERSAPAVPRECATTVNTTATVQFSCLEFGQRWTRCKVYRTLANSSVFKLIGSVDASPAMSVSATFTFVDTYADSDITQNETLYTQIGQELPTSQFPACSFAATGGGRLLCAGGFNGRVGHFSKLFTAHICPEFADDDAFRVRLPANWTGAAFLDNWVGFTAEGIYIISGDGPDGSGVGAFAPFYRLPYQLGCIDWRSVVTCDLGVFFQSRRGIELLPRGFGAPILMDQVEDTLESYPIITSARAFFSSSSGEQVVRFTAVADETATSGVVITYDLMFKTWQVDTYAANYPACFQAEWLGEPVLAPQTTLVGPGGAGSWHPFRVQSAAWSDGGLTIPMLVRTGDVRPWGMFGHGVVNKLGLLGELRSACTLNTGKVSDLGTAHTAQRVYTAAGSATEPAAGATIYIEIPLGNPEYRDITSLRVEVSETSAVEGVALFGLVIEADKKPQGFKLLGPADRVQ